MTIYLIEEVKRIEIDRLIAAFTSEEEALSSKIRLKKKYKNKEFYIDEVILNPTEQEIDSVLEEE